MLVICLSHACHMLVMYPQSEGTNLGSLMQSFGGVARNIAGKPTQSHFILTLLPSHPPTLSHSSSLLGVGMRLSLLTLPSPSPSPSHNFIT